MNRRAAPWDVDPRGARMPGAPPQDRPPKDGRPRNGAARDGAVRDGAVRAGAVRERAVRNGAVQEGAVQEGARGKGLLSDDAFVEAVLSTVEAIPAGKVLAYGDIAELIGRGGPRSVGKVMSGHGGGVPWWRVIRADGSPPRCDEAGARRAWLAEGMPLGPTGKVDMRRGRWDGRPARDGISSE